MKIAKGLAWFGFVVISGMIVYGFIYGNFILEASILMDFVWGKVALVDLYISFFIIYSWIWYREKERLWKATWFILILILGSYAMCLYILIALYRCDNDVKKFLLGNNQ